METKSSAASSSGEARSLRHWVAENQAFLRVLFSISLYSSLILCLMSVMLVGARRLETELLGAVAVVSICAIYVIRRIAKSAHAPRASKEPRP